MTRNKNNKPGKGKQPRHKAPSHRARLREDERRNRALGDFISGVLERVDDLRPPRPRSPTTELSPEQARAEVERLLGEIEEIYPSQVRERNDQQSLAALQWARDCEKDVLEPALAELESNADKKRWLEVVKLFFTEKVNTPHGRPERMNDEQAGLVIALALMAVRLAEATQPELFDRDLLKSKTLFAERVPSVDEWMLAAGAKIFVRLSWDLAIASMSDDSSPWLLQMILNATNNACARQERPPALLPAAQRVMRAYNRLVRSLAMQPPVEVPIPDEADEPVGEVCLLIQGAWGAAYEREVFVLALRDLNRAADLALQINDLPQRNTLLGKAIYLAACCHFSQGEYAAAIFNLSIAARLWPDQEVLFFDRGQNFMYLEVLDEAIADFQTVVSINPENARAYSCLGECQMKSGDLAAARQNLRQALELDPNLLGAHWCLGDVLFRQGDLELSAKYLREAARLEPDLFPPHWLLAQIHMKASQWDYAATHLSEVIRLAPEFPGGYERRAECYKQLGRTAEATFDRRTVERLKNGKP